MPYASANIIVSGYVQGVGYRFFAQDEARILGIKGYVKNIRDGKVELATQGIKEDIEKFISKLKQGPFGAVVEKVDVDWVDYKNEHKDFEIAF